MKRLFSHNQKKFFSYFFLGLFALSIIVPILACFFAVSPLHEVKASVNRYSVGYTNEDLEYVQSPYYEVGSYETAVLQSTYDSLKNIAVANGYTMIDYTTWVARLFAFSELSGEDYSMVDFMFNNQSYVNIPWLSDSLVNVYCELDGSIAYTYWIVSPRIPHVAYLSPIDNNNIAIGCNEYPVIFTGMGTADNYICGLGMYTYLRQYSNQKFTFFNPLFRYQSIYGGIYQGFNTQLGIGEYSSIYNNGTSVAHVFAYSLQYQSFNPTLSSVQPLSSHVIDTSHGQDLSAIYNNLFLLKSTSASSYTFARCQYSLSTSFLTFGGYTSYSLNHGIYNLQASYTDSSSGLTLDCLKAVGTGLNSSYNPYVGDSPYSIFYLDSFTFEPFYPTPTPIPTSLPTITPTPLPLEYDSHIDGYEDGSVNGFLNTLKGYFDNLGSAFSVIPWLASSIGYMFYYLGPFSVFLFIPLIAFISFLLGRNKS